MQIPQRAGRNCHWLASLITSCASTPKKAVVWWYVLPPIIVTIF